MSYIRAGHPLKYVKGNSEDYIYETEHKNKIFIEDYSGISDSGLVELCCKAIDKGYGEREKCFKRYLKRKLAERLKVELRKTPLTDKEIDKYFWKTIRETKGRREKVICQICKKKFKTKKSLDKHLNKITIEKLDKARK